MQVGKKKTKDSGCDSCPSFSSLQTSSLAPNTKLRGKRVAAVLPARQSIVRTRTGKRGRQWILVSLPAPSAKVSLSTCLSLRFLLNHFPSCCQLFRISLLFSSSSTSSVSLCEPLLSHTQFLKGDSFLQAAGESIHRTFHSNPLSSPQLPF